MRFSCCLIYLVEGTSKNIVTIPFYFCSPGRYSNCIVRRFTLAFSSLPDNYSSLQRTSLCPIDTQTPQNTVVILWYSARRVAMKPFELYRPTTVTLLRTPVRRIPTRITPVVWTQCTMLASSEIWLTSLSIPRSSPRHDRILQAATPAALACTAWMPTSPPRLRHAGVKERERAARWEQEVQ